MEINLLRQLLRKTLQALEDHSDDVAELRKIADITRTGCHLRPHNGGRRQGNLADQLANQVRYRRRRRRLVLAWLLYQQLCALALCKPRGVPLQDPDPPRGYGRVVGLQPRPVVLCIVGPHDPRTSMLQATHLS